MAKRPTIADVARRAGVSKALVSYALNDKPGVSQATRRRVLRVADECGWKPDVAARSLSGRRPQTVGLVYVRPVGERSRQLAVPFLAGMQEGLAAHGIAVVLHICADSIAATRTYREWWAERRVEAAVVPDVRVEDPRLEVLSSLRVPTVVLAAPAADRLPRVWRDEESAFSAAAEHLMSIGHRRLGHVAGDPSVRLYGSRSRGLAGAAGRHGAAVQTVVTDLTPTASAAATRHLLGRPVRPTAIIYETDVAAVVGLDIARRLGFDVPWDLSVLAGEDSALCQVTAPAVTALTRDDAALGTAVARRLLAVLHGEDAEDHQERRAVLAVRGSTSPAGE